MLTSAVPRPPDLAGCVVWRQFVQHDTGQPEDHRLAGLPRAPTAVFGLDGQDGVQDLARHVALEREGRGVKYLLLQASCTAAELWLTRGLRWGAGPRTSGVSTRGRCSMASRPDLKKMGFN